MDLHGSIYNTYIWTKDGDFEWDGSRWSLKDLFAFDSAINVSFSYDAGKPSLESYQQDNGASFAAYKGKEITISSPLFEIQTLESTSIGVSVVNGVSPDWDTLFVGYSDAGIRLDHNGDSYFLVDGHISFYDESGLSISKSDLPQTQEIFNDFWRNRPADAYFDQVASFYLQFRKQPLLDRAEYYNDDAFYVIGYLYDAKLSKVPESTGLVLLLLGLLGLVTKRLRCH